MKVTKTQLLIGSIVVIGIAAYAVHYYMHKDDNKTVSEETRYA